VREALELARQPRVVRRALAYAVVVGSLLIAINHGHAILAGTRSWPARSIAAACSRWDSP
jgi:hypothetical protein